MLLAQQQYQATCTYIALLCVTWLMLSFRYGDITSIRVLPDRHCAFVNYTRPEYAAQALKGLQVELLT